jgi:superfamily I DNA and RNA helicase
MVSEFCEKITVLYKDKNLREKMSKNSKELLIKEFSINERNKKLKDVFDKIVKII